jgi:hypothetical protein
MAAFDYAAYYDQFKYAVAISNRLCFRKGGKTYRLRVLGMGQRQAVEIAQTATDAIRDFIRESRICMSVIDNVVFIGSELQCTADATTFFKRCEEANATLNDVSTVEEATAVVSTSGDWCGIHLNLTDKTVKLAGKAVAKTAMTWEQRDSWTHRQFAAHIGLLFWSLGIIDVPMHSYFALLKFIGEVGRRAQADPEIWDTPIEVWPSVMPNLTDWTRLVLANKPRLVPKEAEPDLFVATDASAWGWGFVAFDAVTGGAHHHGQAWDEAFLRRYGAESVQHSVFAEPHAIIMSMCRLLRPDQPRTVTIGTDNAAAEATFRRGYNSRSYNLNECAAELRSLFPLHQFRLAHVPGPLNPADGLSRGADAPQSPNVEGLRRVLGFDA